MKLLQLICRKDKHDDEDKDRSGKMEKAAGILGLQTPLDLDQLLDTVERRIKVRQAAILDRHGNVLHATRSWDCLLDDGHKLAKVLKTAATPGLWKVFLFGEDFHCFHCDRDRTVLGYSSRRVMAAHVTRKHMVVGLAHEQDPGSCLYEMKQVWTEMESRGL